VVFDSRTFLPIGTVPTGAGVWHMWAGGGQLWVANDIDRTATVIDLATLDVLATVQMPADLVAAGGRPHDVVLDPHHGRYAYVTMAGLPGASDYVVKFSTATFDEVGRAPVGKDPHISIDDRYEQLFVPCQGSSEVHVLDAGSLDPLRVVDIPGAHGAGMLARRERFYTTNFPGSGVSAVFAIDTRTGSVLAPPVDAPAAAPHNIALTPDGRRLFVTHSGAASDLVSIYHADGPDGALELAGTLAVGLNPFGIAFVR
jgi:DNA-binding beta-propeller fold protein YncE